MCVQCTVTQTRAGLVTFLSLLSPISIEDSWGCSHRGCIWTPGGPKHAAWGRLYPQYGLHSPGQVLWPVLTEKIGTANPLAAVRSQPPALILPRSARTASHDCTSTTCVTVSVNAHITGHDAFSSSLCMLWYHPDFLINKKASCRGMVVGQFQQQLIPTYSLS